MPAQYKDFSPIKHYFCWYQQSRSLLTSQDQASGLLFLASQLLSDSPHHSLTQSMIIYRMVIVEGCCDKLQLLISYIYNHWLTQKYSEFWLVRYNGLVWSNNAVTLLLPSYIYDPWLRVKKFYKFWNNAACTVRESWHHASCCAVQKSLILKSL